MKNFLIFAIAILVATTSGFAVQRLLQKEPQVVLNPAIGLERVEFSAMDTIGNMRNIKEWDGKIVFLNFWATWCPPCKEEIPHFIELQQEYGDQGLQFIGVAIDDEAAVRKFVDSTGMNYPSLMVQSEGVELAKRYGNGIGILPYTVIINPDGVISNTIQGPLKKERAKQMLEELGVKL